MGTESATPSLKDSMKFIALNLFETLQATDVMFGTVIATDPLVIMTDQKNEVTEQFLILTNMVKDHTVDMTISMQTVEDNYLQENAAKHTHGNGNMGSPTTGTTDFNTTHKHDIEGKKKIILHYGLKVGESVILLRQQGGQRYVVLDRRDSPIAGGEWL